ncbi:MAG: uracil phosphoribosyltransferase [Ignavibacteriaceae bacterium]|nr:uracil phosphoribosyltransferase [Ignavibacteriaceae bacterium]
MKNIKVVSNPLILRDLTILRDKNTPPQEFRIALDRISYSLVVALSEEFKLIKFDVQTPLEVTDGFKIEKKIVLIPVLRAGLSMVNSFLTLIPEARVGHIGLQRNEVTLEPIDYYYKAPKDLNNSFVIVLDPMLATGGSVIASLNFLKKQGASKIVVASIIAAPEGVKKLADAHSEAFVYTAALDRQLNENGYIIPGLGDAGDRVFGTL